MLDPGFQLGIHDIGHAISSIKGGSYFGIFLLSIFISYVIPLPEAVFLMLVGFVAKTTDMHVVPVVVACIAGVIIGDNALYRLSFLGSSYVEKFNRKMRKNKLIKYEYLVKDNIGKAIYFLRFVAGVRFFGPVISGTLGVQWKKFFLYNSSASAIHSLLFIFTGYLFHHRIIIAITQVEIIKNMLLISSALIVGLLLKFFNSDDRESRSES